MRGIKLHCPRCGAEIEKGKVVYQDGISTGYQTKCNECDCLITIDDRSSYEQEGTIEILLK